MVATTGFYPLIPSMAPILEHRLDRSVCTQVDAKEMLSSQATSDDAEREIRIFKMMASYIRAIHETGPITINNISASKAETQHTVQSTELSSAAASGRPTMEIVGDMFNMFFSSGFNRVCFFGACGVGLYIYWSYLDHKWHMEEVQRRIDSNIVLRTTQWLFDTQPLKREVHSSFKLMPSLF